METHQKIDWPVPEEWVEAFHFFQTITDVSKAQEHIFFEIHVKKYYNLNGAISAGMLSGTPFIEKYYTPFIKKNLTLKSQTILNLIKILYKILLRFMIANKYHYIWL